MKHLLTTNEIKEISGISYEALHKYHKLGWLPEPNLKSFGQGGGRGSTLFWSKSVLSLIALIKTLKKAGYKNKQIGKILKG